MTCSFEVVEASVAEADGVMTNVCFEGGMSLTLAWLGS